MLSCLKLKDITPKFQKLEMEELVLEEAFVKKVLSKCAACNSKKLRFIKEQQANWLLTPLGMGTPLRKIPLLGDVFCFENRKNECHNY